MKLINMLGAISLKIMIIAISIIAVTACSPPDTEIDETKIMVKDAYFRLPPPGRDVTAAYMNVFNHSASTVSIEAFVADGVGRIELHNHVHEDGLMKMREVTNVEIPPNAELILEPGGYHLMMFELADGIRDVSTLEFEMRLGSGEILKFNASVQAVN